MKNVRRSQTSISINYCIALSKTQFFPVSIVKINMMTRSFTVRYVPLIYLIYIKKLLQYFADNPTSIFYPFLHYV